MAPPPAPSVFTRVAGATRVRGRGRSFRPDTAPFPLEAPFLVLISG